MKTHTIEFKNAEKELGRQLRAVITYENVTLEEEIYSVTPHFEGDILKSIMKQLDLELSVDIPLETVINCKIGILVNGSYEMLNYGNYVVYKSEKQEDTNTYKLTCYDKILYSMKQNEDLNITYPISIKNYLIAICNKLGLTLKTNTFQNESMMIQNELYLGLDYTYRDILDEIAQATGSIICLDENDEVLVKYPTQTNDTIDEEFLKDVNVEFGQKYGAINTIVLSRSGESDNIFYPATLPENPIEIKIVDNQIMNWNDRSDYLPGIYNALNGLYYYINDFSSTGIMYYDVGDLYNVKVGENTYQCLMLNDDLNITTGIEELIHTDMPEQSETDYTKADKTDRKINQTYLIVDKQNQKIESVVNNVSAQNNKISQIIQTVDEINSKIEDIADITTYGESDRAYIELEGINQSEPVMVKVHPTSENISYLYPRGSLYPDDLLFMPNRIIRFTRTYEENGETLTENIDYELPDDLLRYNDTVYDEFYLNYESQTCQVIKRCKYNADGTVTALGTEVTIDYPYPQIILGDGNYSISLLGYNFAYLYARLMAKNIYTEQFYTKVEADSKIDQKANEINLEVNQRLTNYSTTSQMNSAIALKANEITSTVSRTYSTKTETSTAKNEAINSANNTTDNKLKDYSTTVQMNSAINQKADSITSTVSATYATKTQLNTAKSEIKQTTDSISSTVSTKVGNNEVISKINQSSETVQINANKISLNGKTINLTSEEIAISSTNFSLDNNGNMTCSNANITNGNIILKSDSDNTPKLTVQNTNNTSHVDILPGGIRGTSEGNLFFLTNSILTAIRDTTTGRGVLIAGNNLYVESDRNTGSGNSDIHLNGSNGEVTCKFLTQTSKEEDKKNFEKFENALETIKNIDIYKYNLKNEKDIDKKHIGFVIGDKFNYSKEVTSNNNDGVDIYSFVSLCCQAIKEHQQKIEELERRLEGK